MGLIAVLVLFTARDHAWLLLKLPALNAAHDAAAANSINHAIYGGLVWVVVISAAMWLWQIGQLCVNLYRKRTAAGIESR
jgi:hypothetical protein